MNLPSLNVNTNCWHAKTVKLIKRSSKKFIFVVLLIAEFGGWCGNICKTRLDSVIY